jgi:hypothetical protein
MSKAKTKLTLAALRHCSHGILPAPEKNQTIEQLAAQWGYQTVLHIAVSNSRL